MKKIHTDEFLGFQNLERYRYAAPVLRLIINRLPQCSSSEDKLFGLFFANDGSFSFDHEYRNVVKYLRSLVYYTLYKIAHSRESGIDDGCEVLLSNSIINSPRYPAFADHCKRDIRCIGMSVVGYYGNKTVRNNLLSRRIHFGISVSGLKLRRQVLRVYRFIKTVYLNNNICADFPDQSEMLFRELDRCMEKRVRALTETLAGKGIQQYITCNQYRVEEILMIMACRNNGIKTKELAHNLYNIINTSFMFENEEDYFVNQNEHFFYAEYMCLWDEADSRWVHKYESLKPLLYNEVKICVVGSPEVDEKSIRDNIDKYDTRRIIAALVPAIDYWYTDEEKVELQQKKNRIFEQLNMLKNITNMQVVVRYHPSDRMDDYPDDARYIREFDFEISDSTKEGIEKLFSQSNAVFGSCSSALGVAINYGARVYALSGIVASGGFDFCGEDITEIEIEDISSVDCSRNIQGIAKDALNIEKLFG